MAERTTFGETARLLRHGLGVYRNFFRSFLAMTAVWLRVKGSSPGRKIVLVTLLESFGDLVACEPVVREIRRKDPACFLVWGVKRAFRELVASNPGIDKVLSVHCLSGRILLARTGLFDEVIDLHFPDRHCALCRKPLFSERKGEGISLRNYFQSGNILSTFSRSAGLVVPDATPNVHIPPASVSRVNRLGLCSPYAVVHCQSNAREKDWAVTKWRELIADIVSRHSLRVVEVGAASLFDADPPPGLLSLCGELSFLDAAEVIRNGVLFVGIDSGPAHLANATGTYGIILIGKYLGFDRYMPFSGAYASGENAEMIYGSGDVAGIPVERVIAAVADALQGKVLGNDAV